MTAQALPTFSVGIKFAGGADNAGWSLGYGSLGNVQLGEADDPNLYIDVVADVRAITINRGRSRQLDQYQPGTATVVLDNRSRTYDPLNLSGTYVSGGVTQIQPGRRIKIKATHPTTLTQYTIFTGTVREWQLGYNRTDATTTLVCSDAMTDLAKINITKTTTAGLSGIAAGEVFGATGLGLVSVDAGISTLQATTFTDQNALSAIQTIEQSEQGAVYADEAGILQFDSRHAILTEARSNTSQATFGTGNLPYTDIALDYASDMIRNSVTATRTGGTAQTDSDATSITTYGKRSYSLPGLAVSTDVQALSIADYLVLAYKDPAVRVTRIELAPQYHADTMTQALSRQLRDRVTVTFAPPGGGTISQQLFIEGISHRVSPQGQMMSSFTFGSTATAIGWVLGTSALNTSDILAF